MKNVIRVNPIGSIHSENGIFYIKLKSEYKKGLTSIDGFSHLQIVWWGNLFDTPEQRNQLTTDKPYKTSPEKMGVFATRSQFRPNPVLMTTIVVEKIDFDEGIIFTPYIDTENNTPLLDIKPYHLYERVENCNVPQWCKHWPSSYEQSTDFSWENEFNF
ncbi:TrmO family methyltransferase [Flagellimonas sp. HMM57]|uniref:TrmO family methyltransferase domain-containing protein n=1 Tax=unclassified Flagellimonas TaxID=2644544 RepID=UPI0013D07B0E|nr:MULTISPECIES: TrmO family methyltransferase [unclassified Flagellimonas]UII77837.1 TrmO family methyltransferase [Flagellimonas sp. HMM57]